MGKRMEFEELVGKVFTKVERVEYKSRTEALLFHSDNGHVFEQLHDQDCCEEVWIEEIIGDLDDLVGSPIIRATEDTDGDGPALEGSDESYTWTFYNIATVKGHVTIRWYGTSNGYYGESARLRHI